MWCNLHKTPHLKIKVYNQWKNLLEHMVEKHEDELVDDKYLNEFQEIVKKVIAAEHKDPLLLERVVLRKGNTTIENMGLRMSFVEDVGDVKYNYPK